MRAHSASAFSINDLREIAEICDKHGIKSYLTVNTIIYEDDIAMMQKIIDAAKESGISAVIASDVATSMYCFIYGVNIDMSLKQVSIIPLLQRQK